MSKSILIIEDDSAIRKALSIRLQAAGYLIYTAEDGYMGLQTYLRKEPDLVLLDVSMPAGGGFSIVERVIESTGAGMSPFIVLTASKRPEYREQAELLGAANFFEKPFNSHELLAAIDEALEFAECQ